MPTPDALSDIGVVQISPTPPTIGINGDLWYDTESDQLNVSNEGEWIPVGGGSGGSSQVFVGDEAPEDEGIVIWVDTSGTEINVLYLVGESWVPGLDGGLY